MHYYFLADVVMHNTNLVGKDRYALCSVATPTHVARGRKTLPSNINMRKTCFKKCD